MYDPDKFCDALAAAPYHLTAAAHKKSATAILAAAEKHNPKMDVRYLAYEFATSLFETEYTLQPIREIGEGRGRPYGLRDPATGQVYYGRGLVQTTWKSNYLKLSRLLGADFVRHPDLLLQIQYAAPAMFIGMETGLYTGKRLSEFFNANTEDPREARRIINSLDHASELAGFYWHFKNALQHSVINAAAA